MGIEMRRRLPGRRTVAGSGIAGGVALLLAITMFSSRASSTTIGDEQDLPAIELVRVTTDEQVNTPAVSLLPDSAESQKILLAYDTLLSRCVEAAGQPFGMSEGDRPGWITDVVQPFSGVQPLGPVNPRRMTAYGFHDPLADPNRGAHVLYTGAPTPQEAIVACDRQASQKLGGKPSIDIQSLISNAGIRAGSDPRRDGPRKTWVSCMKQRGYQYDGDGDPITEFALNGMENSVGIDPSAWGRGVSHREIAVAKADAGCQESSRNVDTQVALLTAYENQALGTHSELVDDYRRYLSGLLGAATKVIADYPVPANRVEWDVTKGEGPPSPSSNAAAP